MQLSTLHAKFPTMTTNEPLRTSPSIGFPASRALLQEPEHLRGVTLNGWIEVIRLQGRMQVMRTKNPSFGREADEDMKIPMVYTPHASRAALSNYHAVGLV